MRVNSQTPFESLGFQLFFIFYQYMAAYGGEKRYFELCIKNQEKKSTKTKCKNICL